MWWDEFRFIKTIFNVIQIASHCFCHNLKKENKTHKLGVWYTCRINIFLYRVFRRLLRNRLAACFGRTKVAIKVLHLTMIDVKNLSAKYTFWIVMNYLDGDGKAQNFHNFPLWIQTYIGHSNTSRYTYHTWQWYIPFPWCASRWLYEPQKRQTCTSLRMQLLLSTNPPRTRTTQ